MTIALASAAAPAASAIAPLRDSGRSAAALTDARPTARGSALRHNGTIEGLDSPFAVAINHYSRKIYVTEPARNRVVVFDRLGRRKRTFGASVLKRPTALAFDFSGNLAVLSAGAREIALFRPSGGPIARAPIPAALPLGLAFEPIGRRLLVTDAAADAVWTTRDARKWQQARPGGLTSPVGVAAYGGRFLVVSSTDTRLMVLSSTGDLIRALPLRGARRPLGVTIPPFGNGLVVSSADTGSGLFGPQIGSPLTTFGARQMSTPSLPGSECSRVAFPDLTRDRVVVFELPNADSCTQGLALRAAVSAPPFTGIVVPVVAEADSRLSLRARISVDVGRGPVKRYRLRSMRKSLAAGIEKKLRLKVPGRAAANIRRALSERGRPTATLTFTVRNRAGDRRRVTGRLIYSSRMLRGAG